VEASAQAGEVMKPERKEFTRKTDKKKKRCKNLRTQPILVRSRNPTLVTRGMRGLGVFRVL